MSALPEDAAARNEYPLADGLLDYFPNALAEVARVSKIGNDQHNPGQPMHWARGKSTDHRNKIIRHLIDSGALDSDGTRHTAKVAWRALALLQEELEREAGAPLPRNARLPESTARGVCEQLSAKYTDAMRVAVLGPVEFPPVPDESILPPQALADADDNVSDLKAGEAFREPDHE